MMPIELNDENLDLDALKLSQDEVARVERNFTYRRHQYIIMNTSDLDKVNFEEVEQTSADTVRKSLDGTKFMLKWKGDTAPSFLLNLEYSGPYTNEEIWQILQGIEWLDDSGD